MSPISAAYPALHERFLARLLDTIITLPAVQLISFIAGDNTPLATLAGFLFGLFYYGLFTASNWRATPGKRLVGIYVGDEAGRKLSLRDSIARELAVMVPAYPVYVSFLSQGLAAFCWIHNVVAFMTCFATRWCVAAEPNIRSDFGNAP